MTRRPSRREAPGRFATLVAVALLALVPIAVLSVVLVRVASNAIQDQAESQVAASARASASAVEQELGRLADVVDTYSSLSLTSEAVEQRDAEAIHALIGALYDNANVDLAFVVNADSFLIDVLPESPDAYGVDFSHRDWYQGASAAGDVYVSEAYQPQTDLSLVVVAAAPVYASDGSGEVVGFIGTGLSLVDLQDYIDDFAETQQIALTVTDQAGTVVASPWGAATSVDLDAGMGAVSSIESTARVFHDGEEFLSATSPVDVYGWTVVAEVSEREALSARRGIVTVAIVLAGLLVLMTVTALGKMHQVLGRQVESVRQRRESEAFLESIIENIPSVVLVKRADDLSFVRVNRAGLDMLGLKREDLVGRDNAAFVGAEAAQNVDELDRRVVEEQRPIEIEAFTMPRRFGGRTLNVKKIPIMEGGEVAHILEISDDVTDVRAAMAELETAWAEAEKANKAKSEFLSRMSHELRTPLNAVLGFGQLLEFEELDEQQQASVQQILRGGRHLLGLINEVLDISRIETGNLSLSLEPVALGPLIDETLALVRPLADPDQISMPTGPMPDWSFWVRADQQRLRQVLLNLLSNAVKYNEPGGSITVRCRELSGKRVRISVSDTGSGLTADQVDRIFSPFERLGAEDGEIQGTGLGLALSKRLIEAMHGAIGLETEPGIGSTFWVELGVIHESELMTGSPMGAIGPGRVEEVSRLIHVEDSLDSLRWVEHLVGDRPDVEVISIADAETTLDMVQIYQPDLLLLDLDVAGIDPAELVNQLWADEDTRTTRVITMGTTSATVPGVDRHLVRPISDTDLLAVVAEALAIATAA